MFFFRALHFENYHFQNRIPGIGSGLRSCGVNRYHPNVSPLHQVNVGLPVSTQVCKDLAIQDADRVVMCRNIPFSWPQLRPLCAQAVNPCANTPYRWGCNNNPTTIVYWKWDNWCEIEFFKKPHLKCSQRALKGSSHARPPHHSLHNQQKKIILIFTRENAFHIKISLLLLRTRRKVCVCVCVYTIACNQWGNTTTSNFCSSNEFLFKTTLSTFLLKSNKSSPSLGLFA